MEVTISKENLSQLIQVTQSIADKKTSMPILGNLLLEAEKGLLQIIATDMEITAVAKRPAETKTTGRITVAGKILADVVRELPEDSVTLRVTDGNRLEIRSGRTVLKVIGQSAEEYPLPKCLSLSTKSKVDARQLVEMISKTTYATSQDDTKYYLAGVCLEFTAESPKASLRMVATDGYRLAMVTRSVPSLNITAPSKSPTRNHIIVSRKGLLEAKKAFEQDIDGTVGIDVNDGFLIFETGQTKFVIRLIDGEYPQYGDVIPKSAAHTINVPASVLAQSLRRVALMVSEKGKPVRMELEEGRARITSSSPELGEATEELVLDSKGVPLIVGFNARYVLETLNTFSENEMVILEVENEASPAVIRSESDESYVSVIMPLRVD